MVCRDFILSEICKPCLFLSFFQFAKLILPYPTAYAASTRAAAVVPRISFNGTTASCTVFVAADRPTDDIEAVIKLWQGSKCIETWEASSVGDLAFSGTATVSRGKTYQLTVDVTLEGKAQPRFSVEGTCP